MSQNEINLVGFSDGPPPLARLELPGAEASVNATADQLPMSADDTGAGMAAINLATCVNPEIQITKEQNIKMIQLNMHKSHLATAELTRKMDYAKTNEKIIMLVQEPSLNKQKC